MMGNVCAGRGLWAAVPCLVLGLGGTAALAAPKLTTLVAFNGTNGRVIIAGLTMDAKGNLYGSAMFGGKGGQFGYGTVFEVPASDQTRAKVLVKFDNKDGSAPTAAPVLDAAGNLYGTTSAGGAAGDGTVFSLSGPGLHTLTTLLAFNGTNGSAPGGGVTFYSAKGSPAPGMPYLSGNLFGTTITGGANNVGTVFELSGTSHERHTILVDFNTANGSRPGDSLVADAAGNLYGTTYTGGPGSYGTVFELSGKNHRTLTTLAAFSGPNGANPVSGLTLDAAGNLYGTTSYGGAGSGGTIFKLAAPNHDKLVTLATFGNNDPNGDVPEGTLLIDAAGNLYGTTNGGGDEFGNNALLGAVFKLAAGARKPTPLYAFTGNLDGDIPDAGLTVDAQGNLYGTTSTGGADGHGTVFELSGAGFVTAK